MWWAANLKYRSAGIGAKLVDQAIEFTLQRGWSHLEVEVVTCQSSTP